MAERKTLISDILQFLKEYLSTNIDDPISSKRGKSSRFIMTSFPEREVKYPLITLQNTNIEEIRAGMQTTAMDINLTIELRVWSLSVAQADKLTQEILHTLANCQFLVDGNIDNDFHNFSVGSAVRVDEPGRAGLKSRIIQLNYQFYNL